MMIFNYARFEMSGNLGKDVDYETMQSGTAIAKGFLLVTERVKKQGEWQEETYGFPFTAFGKTAEMLAKHTKKGTEVSLWGRMNRKKAGDNDQVYWNLLVDNFKVGARGVWGANAKSQPSKDEGYLPGADDEMY